MDVGLVCGACDSFNELGAKECIRCSSSLSLGEPGTPAHAVDTKTAPRTAPEYTACPHCGAEVAVGHRFCGVCGEPMRVTEPKQSKQNKAGRETMFFGAMQASRAKLTLIRGDGLDGVSFTLAGQEHLAGRIDAPLLFEDDPYLSPTHANFYYDKGALCVRDEDSANGVYVRIRGEHELRPLDRFLVGEQVLELQEATLDEEDPEPDADGTYFFASPRRAAPFRVVQLLRGGDTGLAFRAEADTVTIGREDNDINFPDDPFISGHHAELRAVEERIVLADLGSKNGTFIRLTKETRLSHGDYVFMGQQLLRVEIV